MCVCVCVCVCASFVHAITKSTRRGDTEVNRQGAKCVTHGDGYISTSASRVLEHGAHPEHRRGLCPEWRRTTVAGTTGARCTEERTATRVDYASSHSSLTLRRPGPAHTQLSNIRGGPRWSPRSYKACLASVGPSCPGPRCPPRGPGPRGGHTYARIQRAGRKRARMPERNGERGPGTCTLIRPTGPLGPRLPGPSSLRSEKSQAATRKVPTPLQAQKSAVRFAARLAAVRRAVTWLLLQQSMRAISFSAPLRLARARRLTRLLSPRGGSQNRRYLLALSCGDVRNQFCRINFEGLLFKLCTLERMHVRRK